MEEFRFLFFVFGGFLLSLALSFVTMLPLFKDLPYRLIMIFSRMMPSIVFFYMNYFKMFARGRDLKTITALSPAMFGIFFYEYQYF